MCLWTAFLGEKKKVKKERKKEKKQKRKKERKKKFAFLIVFLAILVLSRAVELKKCVQMVQIFPLDTHREKFPPQPISLDGSVVR